MRKIFLSVVLVLCSAALLAAEQKPLRILAIGNTFTADAVERHLYGIAQADSSRCVIGHAFINSSPLSLHLTNIEENKSAYSYRLIDVDGKRTESSNQNLSEIITSQRWDYVVFNELTPYSGEFDSYNASLPKLIKHVRKLNGRRTKIALYQTWAYDKGAKNKAFARYNNDQQSMYRAIADATKRVMAEIDVDVIIPAGTAFQNLRGTYAGNKLTKDGYHASTTKGSYLAACTWYRSLFKNSVIGNAYTFQGLKAETFMAMQRAVEAAVENPFEVTELPLIKEKFEAIYDEQKVPKYELPDVLTTFDGKKITTAKQWEARRKELFKSFEIEMFGKAPKPNSKQHFKVIEEQIGALGGIAIRRQIMFYPTADEKFGVPILIYLPLEAQQKAVPVFMGVNFKGNHAVNEDPAIIMPDEKAIAGYGKTYKPAVRGEASSRWPVQEILENGYGVVTMCRHDIDPDVNDGFRNGLHPLFYKKGQVRPKDDEWGTIGAWAWTLSRVMDYLETDSQIDHKRVAIIGHSRLGKTSLWAGACDPRFAIIISNDSGCGGSALSRRRFGESVRRINHNFPHWFCRNFHKYSENEKDLPFDQHSLMALIAPRPLYIASAELDLWADPRGEFLSAYHASAVYELLGAKGLKSDKMPEMEAPLLDGDVAYHIRHGKHDINIYDWSQYLKFVNKYFK